jgi:hypothetical protein
VTYKNIRFDGYAFTDEGMAADFTMVADLGTLLNLYEGSNSGLIANFASIQIYKGVNSHVRAQPHIRRNARKVPR